MPGSSYVDHWLLGSGGEVRPLRDRLEVRLGAGAREAPPDATTCRVSLFRFEGAATQPPPPASGPTPGAAVRVISSGRTAPPHRGATATRWSAGPESSPYGFLLCTRPHPSLENCRASTSIFERNSASELPSYEEPTVDALAPDADEGRGWLRKAAGSCRPSFDPRISEWGNPAGVMPSHPYLNQIG
jgi:hypothetical protein